jgi:lipopolysaccharide biosynthesis glycosyltransferase
MIPIFMGFDPREAIAYHVCANSLVRHSTQPLSLTPLSLKNLSGYQETHTDGSNNFIYSRFLLPHLMDYQGWALFIDGDMLLRDDITKLWALRDDSKAVMCVHHNYKTKTQDKYLGTKNQDYPRKNWSSVVLWNCGHPANKPVTPEFIMNSTGAQLHRFTWLDDSLVGELPIEWNWLPDEFGANAQAKLLHWTLGTPCFHEYANAPMAEEWHREALLSNYSQQVVVEGPF